MNIVNNISNELKIQSFKDKIIKEIDLTTLQKAKELGAIQRERKITEPLNLIWALLIYANEKISIRILSVIATILGIGSISDRAWSKKMLNTKEWLKYIVCKMSSKLNVRDITLKRVIKIVDCSRIAQTGKERNEVRVHTSFNLNEGLIDEVHLTDKHVAESFEHYEIEQGNIIIGDRAYGKSKVIEYTASRQADILARMSPSQIKLYDKEGKKINMYNILKSSKEKKFEHKYYVIENKKKIAVRVICSAIPEDKMESVNKRIKTEMKKHQTKNSKPETKEYAKWIILVTTLDSKEYSIEEVIRLYKLRWQIELLFKRMKQHLEAHKIPKGSYQYAEILVYLWIITWLIVEKEAIAMEKILMKKLDDISQISFWTLCNISYHKVKDIICGGIYANINLTDIVENYKYLLNNIRVREPQLYQWKFSLLIA